MKINRTKLEGCFVIEPEVYQDDRGYFFESYRQKDLEEALGYSINFVQDNQSCSSQGVLRGLHFQIGDYQQAKLVRVVQGSVLDVCVDLRKTSKTYKQHFSIILDAINHKQLFIPRGFAHGFLVLEDDTIFSYKCDNYYNKEYERGIYYNDESLGINWDVANVEVKLSQKDMNLPSMQTTAQWL